MNQQPDLNKNKTGFWSINRQIHHKSIQIQLMGVPGTVSLEPLVSLLAKFFRWNPEVQPSSVLLVRCSFLDSQHPSLLLRYCARINCWYANQPCFGDSPFPNFLYIFTDRSRCLPFERISNQTFCPNDHTDKSDIHIKLSFLECFRMFPQVSTIFHWLTNLSEQQVIKPPQNESSH